MTEHHHKDVYSENKPIPRVQRFFQKGLSEVIERRGRGETESDTEESLGSSEDDTDGDSLAGENEFDQRKGIDNGEQESFSNGMNNGKGKEKERDSAPPGNQGSEIKSLDTASTGQDKDREDSKSKRELKRRKRRNERVVVDPTTNRKIKISDVGRREYADAIAETEQRTDSQAKPSESPTLPTKSPFSSIKKRFSSAPTKDQKISAKLKAKGRQEERIKGTRANNILNLPFPPEIPLPTSITEIHYALLPLWSIWSLAILWYLRNSLFVALSLVASNVYLGWFAFHHLREEIEDRRWEREGQRGRDALRETDSGRSPTKEDNETSDEEAQAQEEEGFKEGAEWLNTLLGSVWEVMDSNLFSSLGSTLEDVMQASIPSFINAVKVVDLAQGSTPIRITGLKILPDREVEDLRNHHEQGDTSASDPKAADSSTTGASKERPDEEKGAAYINFELSLVYRAKPVANRVESKSRNAHLLINFFVGLKKWVSFPLPVWVEIKGFVGTVRLRIQITPDPPFVKDVTFTFVGLPRARIEVVPLRINTSNLPLISNLIESSIKVALAEYVAPSSMKIDLGEIIAGDNVKREVDALGLIVIWIHSASDLEKQDRRGSSDPYCTISYSRQNKVLYATRVALDDLNPRWEERHVLLLHSAAIRAKEKVTISLWDSDRFSSDDVLGRVEIDLVDLVNSSGKLHNRNVTLMGLSNTTTKQGNLQYSVGYFPKADRVQNPVKSNPESGEKVHDSKDEANARRLEEDVKKEVKIEPSKENSREEQEEARQTRHKDFGVGFQMPDPEIPSGILSVQIHQITGLGIVDTKTHVRPNSSFEPGQSFDDLHNDEDSPNAPSSYCSVILNDQTVFVSRVKSLTNAPFFQAGTERFIRDWRRTLIMVVVRDRRLREADPILGVVPIKLHELFKEEGASQVTRFFPIGGGTGRGQVKLSILFRGVDGLGKENSKLGWDVATAQIHSNLQATKLADDHLRKELQSCNIKFSTLSYTTKLSHLHAKKIDQGEEMEAGDLKEQPSIPESSSLQKTSLTLSGDRKVYGVRWNVPNKTPAMKIPLRRRYATPLLLEFKSPAALGRKTHFVSILWLQDMDDDRVIHLRLPIWRADNNDFHRLKQNYSDYRDESEAEKFGVHNVGELDFKMRLKSGIGYIHVKQNAADSKDVMEAWRCCVAQGMRTDHGDFTKSASDDFRDSNDEDGDDGEGSASDSGSESENPKEKTSNWNVGEDDPVESEIFNQDDDESEEGIEGDGKEMGLKEKFKKWSEERKELHRQQRGIKQFKPVRTATWLANSAGDKVKRVSGSFNIQDRRSQHVESEM